MLHDRRPPGRSRSAFGILVVTAAALALASAALPRTATALAPPMWTVPVSAVAGQTVNIASAPGHISVGRVGQHPALSGLDGGEGTDILPALTAGQPVDEVRADVAATIPPGSAVSVDVRGRSGGRWSSWRALRSGPVALTAVTTTVQVRLTLVSSAGGRSPSVSSITVRADDGASRAAQEGAARAAVAAFSGTATVDATREGLVGSTTANGHVIVANDHFVALPSSLALSARNTDDYMVRVCGPDTCDVAPVWDVGPWNTADDYWDPSSTRAMFASLPQGTPEAQAAYQNGFNGGRDQYGRTVTNPAGIDLADGTFHDVLGTSVGSGPVTVTYLFTGTEELPSSNALFVLHSNGAVLEHVESAATGCPGGRPPCEGYGFVDGVGAADVAVAATSRYLYVLHSDGSVFRRPLSLGFCAGGSSCASGYQIVDGAGSTDKGMAASADALYLLHADGSVAEHPDGAPVGCTNGGYAPCAGYVGVDGPGSGDTSVGAGPSALFVVHSNGAVLEHPESAPIGCAPGGTPCTGFGFVDGRGSPDVSVTASSTFISVLHSDGSVFERPVSQAYCTGGSDCASGYGYVHGPGARGTEVAATTDALYEVQVTGTVLQHVDLAAIGCSTGSAACPGFTLVDAPGSSDVALTTTG